MRARTDDCKSVIVFLRGALRCLIVDDNPSFRNAALIDIGLGAECGFELAKQLHLVGGTPSPLILMSAYEEEDMADMIAASPAVGFIPKLGFSVEAICHLLGIAEDSGDDKSSLSEPPGR